MMSVLFLPTIPEHASMPWCAFDIFIVNPLKKIDLPSPRTCSWKFWLRVALCFHFPLAVLSLCLVWTFTSCACFHIFYEFICTFSFVVSGKHCSFRAVSFYHSVLKPFCLPWVLRRKLWNRDLIYVIVFHSLSLSIYLPVSYGSLCYVPLLESRCSLMRVYTDLCYSNTYLGVILLLYSCRKII